MRSLVTLAVIASLVAVPGLATGKTAPPPVRLAGSAVPFTGVLPSDGAVPGAERLTIQVWLIPRDPAGAARYAMAVSTPGSPLFHHFLSPDDYTARFGGAAAGAAAVSDWLRGVGFTAVATGQQRSYVQATAPAAVIDATLGVTMRYYRATRQINAGPFRLRANDRAVQVPAALARSVLAVTGLDNEAPDLPLARPASPAARRKILCSHYYGQHRARSLPREFGTTSFDSAICGYTAWQLRRAYGMNQANDGRGQTIALVELGLAPQMFVTLRDYARLDHMPAPSRSRYAELNLGKSSCPDLFDGEEQLDVEAAYDMAPAARELVVSGNSCNNDTFQALDDALLRILGGTGDKPLASIVSNSWEDPLRPTAAQKRLIHTILIRAAAEGVGMYFASGDTPGVETPSDDPFATGVGGTSLGIGKSGDRLFETGWSTGVQYTNHHHWASPDVNGAAGGGPSPRWAEPAYQKGVVPPALSRHGASRSVPDLSALADGTTGMTVGLLTSRQSGMQSYTIEDGGTSLSTPLVAGMVADAQQGHAPFGFLNPVFYRLAGTPAFHDLLPMTAHTPARYRAVVCGTSQFSCNFESNTPVLILFDDQQRGPNGTSQVTLRGYDNMTGLGSPNGRAFIASLRRLAG